MSISIHALREEGDANDIEMEQIRRNFYPRPPRGGRLKDLDTETLKWIFLSTPSARRATEKLSNIKTAYEISIHALREEGDLLLGRRLLLGRISIHALREEGDSHSATPRTGSCGFLSTPSARRATRLLHLPAMGQHISIHALREEGDLYQHGKRNRVGYFYPRPPRGGRPTRHHAKHCPERFLSTPSARRATR